MNASIFSAIVLAAIAGCSSSDSGGGAGTVSGLCTDQCNAQHKCDSTVVVDTCTKQCENKSAAYAGNIRGDYISADDNCVNSASCNDLASCGQQAAASIAATSTTTDFCNKFVAKQQACGGVVINMTACLNDFKVFTDGALSDAESCFDKSCTDYAPCVTADFGI
jgi:hypothetical protein